jgi:hypothetical protein
MALQHFFDPFARGNPHGCASKVAASRCNDMERLVVDLSVPVGYGYVKQLLPSGNLT